MCFEALIDGDANEKSLRTLIREEVGSALTDATVAALTVVVVLLGSGTGPLLTVGAALGAVVLGVVLHQAVLVVGVALVRWRADAERRPPEPT
ncbi:MAG: hypothetical protein ACI8XM_001167 [Haloarculaceae archaeon]|jgi:hypothetical protein